jgi:hypothetical protein
LHPITWSHFFAEKDGGLMPANLFWSVEQEGIVARCFHLHPLLVYGVKQEKFNFKSTIDDDLALLFNAEKGEEYVVTDSDELIAFEMSSLSHKVLAAYRKNNIEDVVSWALVGTNKKHRELIKHTIRIHATDRTNKKWDIVEQASSSVVDQVLQQIDYRMAGFVERQWQAIYNQGIRTVFGLYARCLGKLQNFFYRVMSSPKGLYPWHWNYPFQREICNPFINMIKNFSGRVLYFDDPYHPLIHTINYFIKNRNDIEIDLRDARIIVNSDGQLTELYREYYDLIVIRDFSLSVDMEHFLGILNKMLKPGGRLILYTKDRGDLKLGATFQAEMVLDVEEHLGGFGTLNCLKLYHNYCDKIKDLPLLRRASVMNTVRLTLFSFFIFLFPIVSLGAFMLNMLLPKNKFWAIKRFDFYRQTSEGSVVISVD